jgi:PAS domain S-box-containing protein
MIFCVVGLSLTGGYSYYIARNALLNRTYEQLVSVREVKARQVEEFFQERILDAEYLSQLFSPFEINSEGIDMNLSVINLHDRKAIRYIFSKNYFASFGFFIPQKGYYRFEVDQNNDIGNYSFTEYKGCKNLILKCDSFSEVRIIDTLITNGKGTWSIPVVAPIYKSQSISDKHYFVVEISEVAIDRIMKERQTDDGMGRTGEAYLVGRDFFMRSSSRFNSPSATEQFCKTEPVLQGINGISGTCKALDYRNVKVLSAFRPLRVKNLNWVITTEIDWSEALSDAMILKRNILLIGLFIILLIAGGILLFSWRITSPLVKLKEAAIRVSEGKFDWVLPIKTRDELGTLTQAFNKMTLRLKHANNRLRERERRLLHFYRATIDGIILHKTGIPVMVNRAALSLTGYSEQELLKVKVNSLFSDDEYLLNRNDPNDVQFFETEMITKNRSKVPVEVQQRRIVFNDQEVDALVIRDISQRRAVESELKEERLQRLRSVIDGQEQERQRLSRELHDGLGQTLVAIKLRLESMHPDRLGEEQKTFELVKNMFNQTIEETRRISNNLMPAALTEFSLAVVLRNLCNEIEENSGITVSLVVGVLPDSLNQLLKTYSYRIAQEALTNIVKHSKANKAVVSVFSDISKLYLHIEDDGCGFSVSQTNGKGNGLFNMKERASLLGGRLAIETLPGKGTKVKAELPFAKKQINN